MTHVQFRMLLVLLPLLAIQACDKDDPPTAPVPIDQTTTIFPMTVGNTWVIDITGYDSLGATVLTRRDSIRVVRDTTIEEERWYIGYGILTNRSDGLYDFQAESTSPVSLRLKFPATQGASYPYRGVTVKVLSVADTMTVQAGTFVCYHYRTGIDSVSYSDEYYARGVGLVKSESYNPLSGGGVYKYLSYTLVSYALN